MVISPKYSTLQIKHRWAFSIAELLLTWNHWKEKASAM